jgi:Membrane domain of glycerophosphoryl diester phosphodiesterase
LVVAAGSGVFRLLALLVGSIAFLFSVGATVHAVSEIYTGRAATIRESMASMRGESGTVFGVMFLSGLLLIAGLIAFVLPMFYIMCRLSVAIPSAVLENLGPADSIRRSFALTRNFAGRAFMIYLLYFALVFGIIAVFQFPFAMLLAMNAKQPQLLILWTILMQLGNFIGSALVAPVSTIGFALFYYDLRVRKEAFDLQMMMQAIGADPAAPPITGGVPSMFGRDAS